MYLYYAKVIPENIEFVENILLRNAISISEISRYFIGAHRGVGWGVHSPLDITKLAHRRQN